MYMLIANAFSSLNNGSQYEANKSLREMGNGEIMIDHSRYRPCQQQTSINMTLCITRQVDRKLMYTVVNERVLYYPVNHEPVYPLKNV